MKDALSLVLGSMASSYEVVEVEIVEKPIARIKRKYTKKVKEEHKPEACSYSAHQFIIACRNAGKTVNQHGKTVFDKSFERNDLIRAIHGYIGYIPTEDFGVQEMQAKMTAAQELRPVKAEAYSRSGKKGKGFVFGECKPIEKKVANLTARIQLAAEEQAKQIYLGENGSEENKDHAKAVELIEGERIKMMRADLELL